MDYLPWRRIFALAVVVLAGLLSVAASEPASAQTVRKSITAYTPAELMSLRRGVATMMSRNTAPRDSADFRRSWIYWANMHSHFGSGCGGAISGNGMTGVTLWTASNPNETATWCKCEHHTPQFLTWHRMFLFYFERVLREASGDASLTLPYWDYATDRRIPAAFRDTTYVNENGDTVPNPLRVEARRVQLNNGSARLGDGVVQTSNAMSATTYGQFRSRIESTPHGGVHCTLTQGGCGNGLMGKQESPPSTRSSTCTMRGSIGSTTAGSRSTRADGCRRDRPSSTRPTRSSMPTAASSRGGSATCCGRASSATTATPPVPAARLPRRSPWWRRDRPSSSAGVTDVTIGAEAPAGMNAEAAAAQFAPARPATVRINGVKAERIPGVLYNVYLANPRGGRELIGVIDFFATEETGSPAHGAHGGAGGRDFDFDATDAVQVLGLEANSRFRLIFEPTTGLDTSTPEEATAAIAPGARVTFCRAWLEWGS